MQLKLRDLDETPWQSGTGEYQTKTVGPGVELWLVPKSAAAHITGRPGDIVLILRGRGHAWVKETMFALSGGIVLRPLQEIPIMLKTGSEELLIMALAHQAENHHQAPKPVYDDAKESSLEPPHVEPSEKSSVKTSESTGKTVAEAAEETGHAEDSPPLPWTVRLRP